ncbi:zinc-binding alcohol dehydrogenase family protein [Marinobacterium jannaschii]|uniref:zinc-binding alcohol dehydrogenase family protein n=1 Tax=Marinobacterium jannaschii TaxID=64970 RepID=UPI0004891C56|nr:zinc-binding alcohol dehydrogenase family protein [Marinobacterium jannaschii]
MKAVGYRQSLPITDPQALEDIELPMPETTGRDLLVKVAAISVNPVDTKVRQRAEPEAGQYKVLGWDAVGEVVAIGDQVEHYKPGDKVWYAGDLTRPGSNAEYQLVDERITGRQPQTLSETQAAALPLTAITAWELLFDRLGFSAELNAAADADKRILIIGAAGGVGSILTQLAAKLTGATVIGTASRPETEAWVKKLGADHVISHAAGQSFAEQLKAQGLDDVSHVISLNHTDLHFANIVDVLAPQGKLALIDDPAEALDIMQLKMKSISLHWEFMYTRSMFGTADMDQQRQLLNRVAELIDSGELITTVGEELGRIDAETLRQAHSLIETGRAIGKVVLQGY